MTWTTTTLGRAFETFKASVTSQLKTITDKLNQLSDSVGSNTNTNSNTTTCCMQPHYKSHSVNLFWIDEQQIEQQAYVDLNDQFPLPACINEKGILFCNDGIIFAYYSSEFISGDTNTGWQEFRRVKIYP